MRAAAAGIAAPFAAAALAQTANAKIIVANPPGGQTDLFARTVAQGIQQRSGQVFTIDNKPGAGGIIGLQALLAAPADGNTLMLATLAQLIAPTLQKQRINTLAEVEPIALLAAGGSLLLVNDKVPASDLRSFIAYAKQNPGKLTYASGGLGSSAHLIIEYFKAQVGLDLVHVPYKGGAPAALALRTGEVDFTVLDEANAAPMLKEGKVRAIAQTGTVAMASFPQLPRVADVSPGFDASFWLGIIVRKGTPAAIVDLLHRRVTSVVQNELQEPIKRAGLHAGPPSRAAFAQFMARESDKWLRLIRTNNITSN